MAGISRLYQSDVLGMWEENVYLWGWGGNGGEGDEGESALPLSACGRAVNGMGI